MPNHELPKTTNCALTTMATALLVPLGIPQEEVEAGVQAMLNRICGKCIKTNHPDRVLPMKEAAERLSRSTKTIRSLVATGRLKAVYCGANKERASGIVESSITAFLEGRAA